MAQIPPDDAAAAPGHAAVGGSSRLPVGSFRFYFADERWEWSDDTARIHGYEAGAVTPTTALVMLHKHPDDRARMAAHLD